MRVQTLWMAIVIPWLILGAWSSRFATAQGSGSSRSTPTRPARPPTTEEFAKSFWRFIVRPQSPYTKWAKIAVKAPEASDGETPHGPATAVYANPTAIQDVKSLPDGAILVIEDLSKDGKSRDGVSVMYRVKDTDPEHNDWYWLRFLPDGSISRSDTTSSGKPMAGKVKSCIDCHTQAAGGDYVFSNDQPE